MVITVTYPFCEYWFGSSLKTSVWGFDMLTTFDTSRIYVHFTLNSCHPLSIRTKYFYHVTNNDLIHSVKSVRIWGYSGLHFPAFGLNTKRYSVSLRIQSECGKTRTRITPNTDNFYAVITNHLLNSDNLPFE